MNIRFDQIWGWLSSGLPGYDDVGYLGDGSYRMAALLSGKFGAAFAGVTTRAVHVPYITFLSALAALGGEHQRALLSLLQGGVALWAIYPLTQWTRSGGPRTLLGGILVLTFVFAWPLTHRAIVEGRPDCVSGLIGGAWLQLYLAPKWTQSRPLSLWSALLFLPMLLFKEPFFPLMLAIAGGAIPFRLAMDALQGERGARMAAIRRSIVRHLVYLGPALVGLVIYLALRFDPMISYLNDIMFKQEGLARWGSTMSPGETLSFYVTGAGYDGLIGPLVWPGLALVVAASILAGFRRDWLTLVSFAGGLVLWLMAYATLTANPIKSWFFTAPLVGIVIFYVGASIEYLLVRSTASLSATRQSRDGSGVIDQTNLLEGVGAALVFIAVVTMAAICWSVHLDRGTYTSLQAMEEGPAFRTAVPIMLRAGRRIVLAGQTEIINTFQVQRLAPKAVSTGWDISGCTMEPVAQCAAYIADADVVMFLGTRLATQMPAVMETNKYHRLLRSQIAESSAWTRVALPTPDLLVFKKRP